MYNKGCMQWFLRQLSLGFVCYSCYRYALSVLAETLEATSPFHHASPQIVDAVPARDQSLR